MSSVVKLHAWYFLFAKVDNWFYYVIDIGLLLFSTKKKNNFPFVSFVYAYSIPNCCNILKKNPKFGFNFFKVAVFICPCFPNNLGYTPPPLFSLTHAPPPPYFQTDYMPLRKCTNFREASRKYIVQCDNHIVSYLTVP